MYALTFCSGSESKDNGSLSQSAQFHLPFIRQLFCEFLLPSKVFEHFNGLEDLRRESQSSICSIERLILVVHEQASNSCMERYQAKHGSYCCEGRESDQLEKHC